MLTSCAVAELSQCMLLCGCHHLSSMMTQSSIFHSRINGKHDESSATSYHKETLIMVADSTRSSLLDMYTVTEKAPWFSDDKATYK